MTNSLFDKPAFTLTVGELIGTIKAELSVMPQPHQIQVSEPQKQYAYSIRECSEYFHVSPVTFQMWKNSGFVKYTQHGRKLIIDLPGTLELLNNKKQRVR
jgi:hypothetical protein